MSRVDIGECRCPGTPHTDGDWVQLHDKLDLKSGVILQEPVADWLGLPAETRPGQEYMRAELAERYLVLGVEAWNLSDEDGLLPVNPLTIRDHLLSDFMRSEKVADAADELYAEVALLPLRRLMSNYSPGGPINRSTSQKRTGSGKPRRRSKPSSTSTSQTGVTVAISA